MKRALFLIFFFSFVALGAEEGEFQVDVGVGAFFPLSLQTNDKSVLVYSSWNVGINVYFGLIDDLDIGFQFSFTESADTSRKSEIDGIGGREYFDYWRFQNLLLFRYNLFAGTLFSPHLIAGGGVKIEHFDNRNFYNRAGKIINYEEGDYSSVNGIIAAGFDFQFRVWEWIILSTQLLYKWSPNDHSIDLLAFFGATFFINYYH